MYGKKWCMCVPDFEVKIHLDYELSFIVVHSTLAVARFHEPTVWGSGVGHGTNHSTLPSPVCLFPERATCLVSHICGQLSQVRGI